MFTAQDLKRGLEKENLRVSPDGRLAHTSHPKEWGAKQTHPFITTDFAECQIELVSQAHHSVEALLEQVESIYRFIYHTQPKTLLWPYSMPCLANMDEIIPADYGHNNTAKMKQVYRNGLVLRYGKAMQIICGIHYNFSLSPEKMAVWHKADGSALSLKDYQSERYMGLIRNYFRWYWLLPYLFGASPIVMKSSLVCCNIPECLKAWDKDSYYMPYATSLRMSRIGYQNNAQSGLKICHNSVEMYAKSLLAATQLPYEVFTKLGLTNEAGERVQLNGNILQIENEYYSPIRPKQLGDGERPAVALLNHGIEYIEVRVSDLNPFLPLGVDVEQLKFMDVFLMLCLLKVSPNFKEGELAHCRTNFNLVTTQGRMPGLMLNTEKGSQEFKTLALELFDEMQAIAKTLGPDYETALNNQKAKLFDLSLIPSARIINELHEKKLSLGELMLREAKAHQAWFAAKDLDKETLDKYGSLVERSFIDWHNTETHPEISFEAYLNAYFAQGKVDDPHRLCY